MWPWSYFDTAGISRNPQEEDEMKALYPETSSFFVDVIPIAVKKEQGEKGYML